jgi:hypothetical protein
LSRRDLASGSMEFPREIVASGEGDPYAVVDD